MLEPNGGSVYKTGDHDLDTTTLFNLEYMSPTRYYFLAIYHCGEYFWSSGNIKEQPAYWIDILRKAEEVETVLHPKPIFMARGNWTHLDLVVKAFGAKSDTYEVLSKNQVLSSEEDWEEELAV